MSINVILCLIQRCDIITDSHSFWGGSLWERGDSTHYKGRICKHNYPSMKSSIFSWYPSYEEKIWKMYFFNSNNSSVSYFFIDCLLYASTSLSALCIFIHSFLTTNVLGRYYCYPSSNRMQKLRPKKINVDQVYSAIKFLDLGSKARKSGSRIWIPNYLSKWLKHFVYRFYWVHCIMIGMFGVYFILILSLKTHPLSNVCYY